MNPQDYYFACFLFCIGLVIYLAKSVATEDPSSFKVIFAKAILNGFTSLFAGTILIWLSVPTLAVIGLAAILGTLGSEVVIKWIKQVIKNNIDKNITSEEDQP